MRANRKRDTKPELRLRAELHKRGRRFRKHLRVPVASGGVVVDVAFTRRRIAVLVDGCFWHACPEHGNSPKTSVWYWGPKLESNVSRDREVDRLLGAQGWTVVRIWEHEPVVVAADTIEQMLDERSNH
jgi:DNA mismatch endonuclease (patch repair protein)